MPVNITNDEINVLKQQKHILMRKFDRQEITEEEYKNQINSLEQQIEEKMKIVLDDIDKSVPITPVQTTKIEEIEEARSDKMDEKKDKPQAVKKPRVVKERKATRIIEILEALKMKSIKNMEQAVDRVMEKRPTDDRKKVASQISLTLGKIKKGEGRWANYIWNAETFTLTDKPQ